MRVLFYLLATIGVAFAGLSVWALFLDLSAERARAPWLGLFRTLGEAWSETHLASLQLLQPAIERHLSESLYLDYVQPLLLAPGAPVLAGAALGFFIVGRIGLMATRPR